MYKAKNITEVLKQSNFKLDDLKHQHAYHGPYPIHKANKNKFSYLLNSICFKSVFK